MKCVQQGKCTDTKSSGQEKNMQSIEGESAKNK